LSLESLSPAARQVVAQLLDENRVAFTVIWIARLCELRIEEAHAVMLELWDIGFSGKKFAEEEGPSPALLYQVEPLLFERLRAARARQPEPRLFKPYLRSRLSPLALRLT
jgi:hypothetical protein